MPRLNISCSTLTSQNQGGGSKKSGNASLIGLKGIHSNLMKTRAWNLNDIQYSNTTAQADADVDDSDNCNLLLYYQGGTEVTGEEDGQTVTFMRFLKDDEGVVIGLDLEEIINKGNYIICCLESGDTFTITKKISDYRFALSLDEYSGVIVPSKCIPDKFKVDDIVTVTINQPATNNIVKIRGTIDTSRSLTVPTLSSIRLLKDGDNDFDPDNNVTIIEMNNNGIYNTTSPIFISIE